jgi:hypothetical protein
MREAPAVNRVRPWTIALVFALSLSSLGCESRETSPPPQKAQTILSSLYYWEIHPNDEVRVVEQLVPEDRSRPMALSVPYCLKDAKSSDPSVFGARLTSDTTTTRAYRGREYAVRELRLVLEPGSAAGGYEITLARPPHIHETGPGARLLSIGVNPAPAYRRRWEAVALPTGTSDIVPRDLQPLDSVERGAWTILLYDVSDLRSHGSIHVSYRPGPDAAPLPLDDVLALGQLPARR